MGLFLAMSGVVGTDEASVVESIRAYAETNQGLLEEAELTTEDDDCMVISEGTGGVTVLYPSGFFDWDNASQFLSRRINKPVFSFHIHDGDLWMYSLYDKGALVDQFNPLPNYWEELEEDEQRTWKGNAFEVAKRVPGLSVEQISMYLVQWTDDFLKSDVRKKAYPTDQFHYGDDWQLTDFMDKVGLDYPIDDRGSPHGITYRFNCLPPG